MKTKMFLLTTAAVLSTGLYALLAQDAPPPPPAGGEGKPPGGEGRPPGQPPGGPDRLAEFIKRADTDNDGKISKEEFVVATSKESEDRFTKTDGNSDGALSKDEFLAATKKGSEDQFGRMDGNGDGYADRKEIEETGRRMREMQQGQGGQRGPGGPPPGPEGGFRRPEGDGTRPRPGPEGQPGGPIPGGETGFRRPEGSGGGEGMRRGGDGRSGGFGSGSMMGLGDIVERLDKDGDKALNKEEFLSMYVDRFTQMDENKDGKVSKEESDAFGKRMRELFSGGRPGGEGSPGGFRRPEGGGGGGGGEGGGFRRPEGGNRPEGERPKRPEGESPAPTPPNN
jgi:Ca2+-binding EF-hand superfamily protein